MGNNGTAIHLEACAKTFANSVRALAPLDLEIAGGETVVLLGRSEEHTSELQSH